MKTSVIIIFFLLTTCQLDVFSQTNNAALLADIYQRASTFYEQDKFAECLTLLERAETLAGEPDAKILYLKIKVLSPLVQKEEKYANALEKSISTFMTVANEQSYDPEKVQEIVELQQKLIKMKIDWQAQKKEEMELFEKIKSTENSYSLDAFLSKYPNSAYKNEVLAYKKTLQQKRYEEQLRRLDDDFKKAKAKIAGGRFMVIMGVVTTIGWGAWVLDYMERSNANTSYDPMIAEGIISACTGIIPLGFFIQSGITKKKGKVMLREVEQKRPMIRFENTSLAPKFNFHQGQSQYGMTLRLQF